MGFNCAIVGLPNVGKSTIFNAITAAGAESANYPFCTIEPNIGIVNIPDSRLDQLGKLVDPEKIIPTTMEFKQQSSFYVTSKPMSLTASVTTK